MGYSAIPLTLHRMAKVLWEPRQQAFREALRAMRKAASLSQVELAEKLDKPQSFVSKYESGERRLEYVEVELVCRACGKSLSEFAEQFQDDHPLSD